MTDIGRKAVICAFNFERPLWRNPVVPSDRVLPLVRGCGRNLLWRGPLAAHAAFGDELEGDRRLF